MWLALIKYVKLIPAPIWRWLALIGIACAFGFYFYTKGLRTGERELEAYKSQVEVEQRVAATITNETIKRHQAAKETADAQFEELHTRSTDALRIARMQLLEARRSSGVVPAAPAGAPVDSKLCASRGELDNLLSAALDRLQERVIKLAQEGQRGIDVATVCRDWTKGTQ